MIKKCRRYHESMLYRFEIELDQSMPILPPDRLQWLGENTAGVKPWRYCKDYTYNDKSGPLYEYHIRFRRYEDAFAYLMRWQGVKTMDF